MQFATASTSHSSTFLAIPIFEILLSVSVKANRRKRNRVEQIRMAAWWVTALSSGRGLPDSGPPISAKAGIG